MCQFLFKGFPTSHTKHPHTGTKTTCPSGNGRLPKTNTCASATTGIVTESARTARDKWRGIGHKDNSSSIQGNAGKDDSCGGNGAAVGRIREAWQQAECWSHAAAAGQGLSVCTFCCHSTPACLWSGLAGLDDTGTVFLLMYWPLSLIG